MVFVLDPDPSVRWVAQTLVTAGGLDVRGCADLSEFLAAYDPGSPSCLLLDCRTPSTCRSDVLDGLADAGVELPVILVAEASALRPEIAGRLKGRVRVVGKPCVWPLILGYLRDALEEDAARIGHRSLTAR